MPMAGSQDAIRSVAGEAGVLDRTDDKELVHVGGQDLFTGVVGRGDPAEVIPAGKDQLYAAGLCGAVDLYEIAHGDGVLSAVEILEESATEGRLLGPFGSFELHVDDFRVHTYDAALRHPLGVRIHARAMLRRVSWRG